MFRTIRNHWKKSLFAFCSITYGTKWSYERYQANQIRQFYCRQALFYGSQTLPSMGKINRLAVLINGKSNNGKAKSIYDKTIYPLLHLTGLDVRVYRLDSANDLKDLLSNTIEPNELGALMIVGGDGTLSELIPYLNQSPVLENLPICVVPIGENVSFARSLFSIKTKSKLHDDVSLLCESVFALFNGKIVRKPLLKITMSNNNDNPIYATQLDFGHYSRLEQIQKRLWYFSYLKYPISSIYHFLTNSLYSITSKDQSSIVYKNPCTGCTRCQPLLIEQYRLSKKKSKSTFFSRLYQSNRSNETSSDSQMSMPVENPNCGVEYCLNIDKQPIQLWAKISDNGNDFQLDLSDDFQRFNYDNDKYPKQSFNVKYIRFNPNRELIEKNHMLINHEKFQLKKDENITDPLDFRIELSEKSLKFLQISNDSLLKSQNKLGSTVYEQEEDILDKQGIFLFSRRHQNSQPS